VMGSRRHTPGFVARLREAGADLGRLHSPTGLDLGAPRAAASASWEGQRKAPSRPRAQGPRFSSGPSIPRTAPPSPVPPRGVGRLTSQSREETRTHGPA
jgi:hypothetical protein